jgi:hypothetical protein
MLRAVAAGVSFFGETTGYQVRRKMGIKSEYRWVLDDDRP